jgi:hypothetical protein
VLSRDKYCSLIYVSPKWSVATYLDSGNKVRPRRYTRIKGVLDDALEAYAQKGGPFHKKSEFLTEDDNTHKFLHGTGFHCVKQLDGSVMEAYYALHHLKAIVRDYEKTKIPSGLAEYTKMADALTDADYRTDFHRIRLQLSTIILEDVIRKSGSFHYPRGIIEVHV